MPVIGYPKDNVEPFLGDRVPAALGGFVEGIISVFAHTSSEARQRRRLEKLRVLDPTHFGGVEDIVSSNYTTYGYISGHVECMPEDVSSAWSAGAALSGLGFVGALFYSAGTFADKVLHTPTAIDFEAYAGPAIAIVAGVVIGNAVDYLLCKRAEYRRAADVQRG